MRILAGDIGGTHSRLGCYEWSNQEQRRVLLRTFPSHEYGGLAEIVQKFASEQALRLEGACFGIACPVHEGSCEVPNLGWKVDAQELAHVLQLPTVSLINDLEANAYGLAVLRPKDLGVLKEGSGAAHGNRALISAGTGLGEAGLYWDGARYRPFASEGGHCDFAPRNQLEADLLLYLEKQFGHVSYERVLSGPGLHNIYKFMRDTGRDQEQSWVRDELGCQDPAATISRLALADSDSLCVHSLELFISLYGAEAGNLALKMMATGGVYLGGGIAPKLTTKLRSRTFVDSFVAKGRLSSLVNAIPIRVVLNENTALLGAAHFAVERTLTDPEGHLDRRARA